MVGGGSGGGGGDGATSEGSADSPINAGDATAGAVSYEGEVGTSESYYSLGVAAGTTYTISLTGLSDNADLYVYDSDSTGALNQFRNGTLLCSSTESDDGDESCDATPTGDTLYIVVDGSNTESGATFTLGGNGNACADTDGDGICDSADPCNNLTNEGWCFFTANLGTFNSSPTISYQCASSVFDLSVSDWVLADAGGGALGVTGDAVNQPLMSGAMPTEPAGQFQVIGFEAGLCEVTSILTGTFSDEDNWSGTYGVFFSPAFSGACSDCVNQSWSVSGSR